MAPPAPKVIDHESQVMLRHILVPTRSIEGADSLVAIASYLRIEASQNQGNGLPVGVRQIKIRHLRVDLQISVLTL